MKVNFGHLEVLAMGRETKRNEKVAFCFCHKYNRYNWIRYKNLTRKHKPTKSGKMFPVKDFTLFKNFEQWLNQFPCIKLGKNGYYSITFKGKEQLLHRLKWEFYYGTIPKGIQIDHIDRNPLNNNLDNLRLADESLQKANRKFKTSQNNRGIRKRGNNYAVTVKGKYIGSASTEKEAINIRDKEHKRLNWENVV